MGFLVPMNGPEFPTIVLNSSTVLSCPSLASVKEPEIMRPTMTAIACRICIISLYDHERPLDGGHFTIPATT
jgi:hypothetical protein